MLTPEEIDALIEPMQPLIDDLNTFILKDIVHRLMARLRHGDPFKLSQSDIWQIELLREANAHYEAVQAKLAKWTGKADREIAYIFEDAGITAWNADRAIYEKAGKKTLPSTNFRAWFRSCRTQCRGLTARFITSQGLRLIPHNSVSFAS